MVGTLPIYGDCGYGFLLALHGFTILPLHIVTSFCYRFVQFYKGHLRRHIFEPWLRTNYRHCCMLTTNRSNYLRSNWPWFQQWFLRAMVMQCFSGVMGVLLPSEIIWDNTHGQCNFPPLDKEMRYTQISAGLWHTVPLRSDGCAVAIGEHWYGQCNIPALNEGMAYAQISASRSHAVLLRSDGSAVAIGKKIYGQCGGRLTCGRDLGLQLEFLREDDAVALICLTLAGEERLRATTQGIDAAWETHKRIAREMNVNLPNLLFVLPDVQLLHAGN